MAVGKGGKRPRMFERARDRDKTPSRLAMRATDAGQLSETQRQLRRDDALKLATASTRWGEDVWYAGAEYPPGLHSSEMVWCNACRRYMPGPSVRLTLRRFLVLSLGDTTEALAGVYGSCYADAKAEAMATLGRVDLDVVHVHSDGICDDCAIARMPVAVEGPEGLEPGPALALPSSTSVVTIYQLHPSERNQWRTKAGPQQRAKEERRELRRQQREADRARRRFRVSADPAAESPMKVMWREYRQQRAESA